MYLCNHHVAVKGALAVRLARSFNMFSDLGDDWGSKSDVGDKVAVPRRIRGQDPGASVALKGLKV